MRELLAELRTRGVLTVALAYVVAGYAIMEASAFLFPRIGFPESLTQLVITAVILGFPIALLVAWRVKKDDRTTAVHPVVLTALFLGIAGLSGWLGYNTIRAGLVTRSTDHRPLILMMDSPHPSRVYDEETLKNSASNADILNDLLRDLPIERYKEAIGPGWHRDEEIRQLEPDLILIHLSGFCIDECDPDRLRLRRFIEYVADTDIKFLIYSRAEPDTLKTMFNRMMADLPQRLLRAQATGEKDPRARSTTYPETMI